MGRSQQHQDSCEKIEPLRRVFTIDRAVGESFGWGVPLPSELEAEGFLDIADLPSIVREIFKYL